MVWWQAPDGVLQQCVRLREEMSEMVGRVEREARLTDQAAVNASVTNVNGMYWAGGARGTPH